MHKYSQIHSKLLKWYETHGRHSLAWRNTDNPYHIYLSEIMLQQTQVSRVEREYYPKFLEKYPTIERLAKAQLEDVLSSWSGLGYYRRAKNLHLSAQVAQKRFPQTTKEFLSLPGVGRYTASAVCSFAYEHNIPVVDTNIARVLKRYFALLDVKDAQVWKVAEEFLNNQKARAHNLALMDLGSMICLANNPQCSKCPLEGSCKGKEEPQLYTQKKRTEYIQMDLFFGLSIKDNKIALKISNDGMYEDMLVLPSTEPIEEHFLGKFKHSYTKYRLDVHLYSVEEIDEDVTWLDLKEFDSAPISSLTKKAKRFF